MINPRKYFLFSAYLVSKDLILFYDLSIIIYFTYNNTVVIHDFSDHGFFPSF